MYIDDFSGGGGGGGDDSLHLDPGYYILKYRKPVRTNSTLKWARFFETNYKRRVRKTCIHGYRISTVFLGLDHNWNSSGPPLLFETMIFDDENDEDLDYVMRCCTWREALKMHREAVRFIKMKLFLKKHAEKTLSKF